MSDAGGSRGWVWMALFSLVFFVVGVLDLTGGETLTGSGLLVCGFGSTLFAVGDRRSATSGRGRPWRILGGVVSLIGIGLLSLAVFGGS